MKFKVIDNDNMNNEQLKKVISELQIEIKKLKNANFAYRSCIKQLKKELKEANGYKDKVIKQIKSMNKARF